LIHEKKFLFGGRILSNRGIAKVGVKSTLSNCYVIAPLEDSIESIFECAAKLARTFSYGGGCGIDLSKLAPAGAKVNNTAKKTSGAISFMELYSAVTGLIGQNGRRGALMISLDCTHPDLEDFIKLKSDLNKVTKANISVRVSDAFMCSYSEGRSHVLSFKRPESGENIHREVSAADVFRSLAEMNWQYAEPGVLFWDRIKNWNLLSNTPDFDYAGVNPCAEEPLPAGGSCLLGSLNLSEFVKAGKFDADDFKNAIKVAVRALNDVLDTGMELHPLEEQRQSVKEWRQIGLGVFGIADMLIKLELRYGSDNSLDFCHSIGKILVDTAIRESALLAAVKGAYPCFDIDAVTSTRFFRENTTEETKAIVFKHGLCNSQILTIAPTGTLSTMLGVSGGIEPIFANFYTRKTESLHGEDVYYKVYTPIVKAYMEKNGLSSDSELPEFFVTAENIPYMDRLRMQAVWQKNIDASISSTVNVPNSFSIDDTEKLYKTAWELGLKGVTIFRAGCERAGILIADDTNSDTLELRRGDIVECSDNLLGKKRRLTVGCGTIHCTAWFDRETGDLMETYIPKGSTGGCDRNQDAVSRLISLSSRGGVGLEDIIDQLMSCSGCSAYRTRTKEKHDTSKGSSCPTAIAYALVDMHDEAVHELNITPEKITTDGSVPKCAECGEPLAFEGGCNICKACGWSRCE